MMVLLSKREYDDLVQRASGVEGQVEMRLGEERRRILEALQKGIREVPKWESPYEALTRLVTELLR